jgi:hypothetical protein
MFSYIFYYLIYIDVVSRHFPVVFYWSVEKNYFEFCEKIDDRMYEKVEDFEISFFRNFMQLAIEVF